MNLAESALRRPVTVMVVVVGILLAAGLALLKMPRDIFPSLGTPTIYVAQPYGGMDPAQMEGYLTYYYEYHFLYITGIEPVGNLVFSSSTRSVGEMQDAALNLVRPLFATLPGVSAPPPFGGAARTILINAKPERLRAYNMSPDELVLALTAANTITPSGNVSLGDKYPMVPLNSVVHNIKDLEAVPVRTASYPAVFVRDVATVTDGSDIITSYALVNGHRTVYIPVTKRADASTLTVVNLVRGSLPKFQSV